MVHSPLVEVVAATPEQDMKTSLGNVSDVVVYYSDG